MTTKGLDRVLPDSYSGPMTTTAKPRTRRHPDGGYASQGGVRQSGGSLPVYVCNTCNAEVVWAESRRTGRKYLANVLRSDGLNRGRYYRADQVHDCAARLAAVEAEKARMDNAERGRAVLALIRDLNEGRITQAEFDAATARMAE